MNRTSIFIIIIIFLLVTNLATILTALSIGKNDEVAETEQAVIDLPRERRMGYFYDQIGVNEEQIDQFNAFHRDFSERADMLSFKMTDLRHQMVDELASDMPDTVLLEKIANEFGVLHEEMKLLTMDYYFNLKSVSNEQQRERLHFMFRDMLDPDGSIYGRGRGGQGRGLRRGGGRLMRERDFR